MPPIGRLSRPLAFVLPRGATARRLGIALAVLALLGGGWLLLRKSPLVSVEHVQIAGVQGIDAGPIDAALRGAARGMSTLNVNVAALRAAVAPYRVVRNLSVSTSFPHGLRIHVIEQLPVAALSVGGAHTAVAADGVVLGPDLLASERVPLPAITITLAAGTRALTDLRLVGGHVENATARAELTVLGAAPRVLLGWVGKVFTGSEGLTVAMRNGLSIYFGDATRPHAKWLSAARVLADPSSAGATYVDVRAPERPGGGHRRGGGVGGRRGHGAGGCECHRRDLRGAGERPRGSDQRWVGQRERHRIGGWGRERSRFECHGVAGRSVRHQRFGGPRVERHRTEHDRSGRGQFRRRYRG